MRQKNILLALSLILLLCAACSSDFDRNKFEGAANVAREIQGYITTGAEYGQLSEMVGRLSSEVTTLKVKAGSEREKQLLKYYEDLLDMYRDGLLLLKYKMEFTKYNFVPHGLIYVGQDIEPIVEKYKIETKPHIFKPTGQAWNSISGDSINVVWFNAGIQFKKTNKFPES